MKLLIVGQDYRYGPCSNVQTIPLGSVITIPCDAFPDEEAANRAIDEGFAEEYHD